MSNKNFLQKTISLRLLRLSDELNKIEKISLSHGKDDFYLDIYHFNYFESFVDFYSKQNVNKFYIPSENLLFDVNDLMLNELSKNIILDIDEKKKEIIKNIKMLCFLNYNSSPAIHEKCLSVLKKIK